MKFVTPFTVITLLLPSIDILSPLNIKYCDALFIVISSPIVIITESLGYSLSDLLLFIYTGQVYLFISDWYNVIDPNIVDALFTLNVKYDILYKVFTSDKITTLYCKRKLLFQYLYLNLPFVGSIYTDGIVDGFTPLILNILKFDPGICGISEYVASVTVNVGTLYLYILYIFNLNGMLLTCDDIQIELLLYTDVILTLVSDNIAELLFQLPSAK